MGSYNKECDGEICMHEKLMPDGNGFRLAVVRDIYNQTAIFGELTSILESQTTTRHETALHRRIRPRRRCSDKPNNWKEKIGRGGKK